MNSNPHYGDARSCFSAANAKAEPEFNEAVRADALIQSTLALAYEQRTANLIALFGEGFAGSDIRYGDLFKQIQDRLGLR